MSNEDQIDYWNGQAGQEWVAQSEGLDELLAPFAEAVIDKVRLEEGEKVLDIGCGAGALTLMAAERVGDSGSALGVDVSKPLIEHAKARAKAREIKAAFEVADASSYQSAQKLDAIISRFGVMFFNDPITAFASIRRNMKAGGRMTFVCWQSFMENDWARAPLEAALPFLPEVPPPPPPNMPGPFAFADKDYVHGILKEAGWSDITIEPRSNEVTLPGSSIEDNAKFMMRIGPVSRLIKEAGLDALEIMSVLQENFEKEADANGQVKQASATWIVSAVHN